MSKQGVRLQVSTYAFGRRHGPPENHRGAPERLWGWAAMHHESALAQEGICPPPGEGSPVRLTYLRT